jgi:hypothetical protein
MWYLTLTPFVLQAVAIFIDELYFHHKRGLPKWERIGHPLDTLSLGLCFALILWLPYSTTNLMIYTACAVLSCLLVTKDEFVHKEHCPGAEHWLHALLFILHPIVLTLGALMWPVIQGLKQSTWLGHPEILNLFLHTLTAAVFIYFLYQVIYWNFIWKKP